MNVPLRAAFGGVRCMPWIALSHSSIAPLLVIGEDWIEYRIVMGRKRRPISAIEGVDFRSTIGTRNICLSFRGSVRTFTGNVRDDAAARSALALLHARGCQLSESAAKFVSSNA